MRKVAWVLLVLMAFAIPWEYSLDLGEPWGNIARLLGLALLLAAITAAMQARTLRKPGALQWLVLILFLWFCCSYFWTIVPLGSLEKMRGYLQEMMLVWLVWELVESPRDIRALLRAYVAGAVVLAALTMLDFRSAEAMAAGQIRFVAEGQDPNDVARFLDIGFPLAAVLIACDSKRIWRIVGVGYPLVGMVAVVLTASRGGLVGALLALAGSSILLGRSLGKRMFAGAFALPVLAAVLWYWVPSGTLERLATLPTQLKGSDLNQRWNIWHAGWGAFLQSPWIGSGAGSFTSAARTLPLDTAHNTVLSIAVGGGLIAVVLAFAVGVAALRAVLNVRGPLRTALVTAFALLLVLAMVDTVEENRVTWLLLGVIGVAGRTAFETPEGMEACFPETADERHFAASEPGLLASLDRAQISTGEFS